MTLRLEYDPDVKYHKAFYGRPSLVSYANSNYAGNIKSRQSTMGYVYYLNRMAVFWLSKRVKTFVISSTKTEYVALSNALK